MPSNASSGRSVGRSPARDSAHVEISTVYSKGSTVPYGPSARTVNT
ncbi:hypothetical protein [Streptomyces sp. AC602_WCS936]|nr:hypothetical protein [Streptomyces sp. AC602_WCS936]